MSVFKTDCPYCSTKNVAFTILQDTLWSKDAYGTGSHSCLWDALSKCGYCGRGIVATFLTNDQTSPQKTNRYELKSIAPPSPVTSAPKYTPKNAARFFEQAMNNLPKNWDAAGSMFRKALEAGLKSKFPDMKGSLYDRIKKAKKEQALTPELAEWSHRIRLDGNDAAHEALFSEKEAKDLATFTQLVFQYLFMLPGMLEEARYDPDEAAAAEGQE